MSRIDSVAALEEIYNLTPSEPALVKVTDHLTPAYRTWIERSRFCVLTTVGPEGTDGSPRGDDGPVVRVADPRTLLMPDWKGNNRIDSLRNIVRDGRVSLMFMVTGSTTIMRVNGRAHLTTDDALRASFAHEGAWPRSVIVVAVTEVYSQCARAVQRAGLWGRGDDSAGLPTVGQMLADAKAGFDGAAYDRERATRAHTGMW
jgi:PPOX class probable FMN-dependent enzyme